MVPALAPDHVAEAVVRTDAPGTDLGKLEALAPVAEPGLRARVEAMQPLVQAGDPTIKRVEDVAHDLVMLTRPQFPVVGDFNWGQSGAQFGAGRSGRTHEGQDVFARTGTPLVAVREGEVVETGNDGGRGNYVAIYSAQARQTYVYLHMSRPSRVNPGQRVRAGQGVGAGGLHRLVLRHPPALRGARRQGHSGGAHRPGAAARPLGAQFPVAPGAAARQRLSAAAPRRAGVKGWPGAGERGQ